METDTSPREPSVGPEHQPDDDSSMAEMAPSDSLNSPKMQRLGEAWREGERHFREMIDALPEAVYATDAEGRLTYFNAAAVELAGRKPELGGDLWGRSWKLFHSDGTPMPYDESPMALALRAGRSIRGAEATAERPDGTRIWFKIYSSPLRKNGEIAGSVNVLVDVTERKRPEKQVHRSKREHTDFFENAAVSMHRVGPDGTILWANQAELDLLGYSRDEYVGHHIADFHVDQDVIEDILQRLSAAEELNNYEARLRCKDGSIRHVLISSNVYWENGEFIHTRCITRDITERKRAEQALRESKEQLASKMDDMKRLHALSVRLLKQSDVEAALHEVMAASAELLRADKASVQIYDEQDDVLRLVSTLGFDQDFVDRFQVVETDSITTCAAALDQGEQVLVEDLAADPDYAEFSRTVARYDARAAFSTPLYGSDDQLLGMFTMYWCTPHRPDEDELKLLDLYTQQAARQIERRRAAEALREFNETLEERVERRTEQVRELTSRLTMAEQKERRRLARILHDDLQQRLYGIQMRMSFLQKHAESGAREKLLDQVAQAGEWMDEAIETTRQLSVDLHPPVLENEGLADALGWLQTQMKEMHGLEVELDADGKVCLSDEDMQVFLFQVVRELLFNVVKHARVNRATVELKDTGSDLAVCVIDDGCGFDAEEVDERDHEKGFGLTAVRERLKLFGGGMKIESAPGEGTRVTAYVPLDGKRNGPSEE